MAVGGVTVGRFDCEGARLWEGVVVGGLWKPQEQLVVLALLRGSSKSWIFQTPQFSFIYFLP